MYYVYILKSLKDGKKYIGLTNEIDRRLKQHNNGEVSSTKSRRPFFIIKMRRVSE
ncbi:MAG: GIY-YIG nuclease family protein [Bacteroidota bacterium]|nr:GIY-YIG nuclease family protein [Bacteroidota bacterium]